VTASGRSTGRETEVVSSITRHKPSPMHGTPQRRYLSREEKLAKISEFASVAGIAQAGGWQTVEPDQHGDWLGQRDNTFEAFMPLGDKGDGSFQPLFDNYSSGVKTNRDFWVYNFSRVGLVKTVSNMIDFYNSEVDRYKVACEGKNKTLWPGVDSFLEFDSTKMSWSHEVKEDLARQYHRTFDESGIVKAIYRPFTKTWMYFNQHFNNRVYQMPKIFPENGADNQVIWITGLGTTMGFTCFMSNILPDLQGPAKIQCFPLYLYSQNEANSLDTSSQARNLFSVAGASDGTKTRRDAITDAGLEHFLAAYPNQKISKEDVFYYVYGLLHSPEYRSRYADNLTRACSHYCKIFLLISRQDGDHRSAV
jgi:predicted helicase